MLQQNQSNENSEQIGTVWLLSLSCWLIASIATLGSLFFSEIMRFPPCVLCWYQRIGMYPLVLILFPALLKFDRSVIRYSLPLALVGWFFAIYHNLLNWGIIPKSASPCQQGVSCTTEYINLLGFITIPLLSFTAFTLIIALLITIHRKTKS